MRPSSSLSGVRVDADEATAFLRDIVRGRRALALADPQHGWARPRLGEVEFVAGDARCRFLADHAMLDQLARLEFPDGRRGCFDDWLRADAGNPLDRLEPPELETLAQLLHGAR